MMQRILWILWPSFLAAAGAEFLFFALFDPTDLHLLGQPLEASRQAIYTAGFFCFWAIGAVSSALTTLLERSPWEVNRCPLPADGRPAGCPRKGEPGSCDPAI